MKILLTGGSGFTGTHFKRLAEIGGFKVICLQADLSDYPSMERELQSVSPDYIVHLAAISFVGHGNDLDFYQVNTIGSANLLKAALSCNILAKKILIASSANIYGNCVNSPISETEKPAPVNHYAASKLAMEQIARTFLPELPLVFVRPFNYTGAGQAQSFLIPKLVNAFASRATGIELGNLKVEREFNDVRDVCRAYISLLDNANVGETFNVCSGKAYTLEAVIAILESITRHRTVVKVNQSLVRTNEVIRLCGDDRKLVACTGHRFNIELMDTLRWMLLGRAAA